MHLTASIQPSEDALRHLGDALRSDLSEPDQLTWRHRSQWRIRLADFGQVLRDDALTLSQCLARDIARSDQPTLRLEHVQPLPVDGDDSVWVGIGGDADVLTELASAIPQWARQAGFVPDRRSYYSGLRLARVTARTTVGYLESLANRLGDYAGPVWTSADVVIGVEKLAGPDHPPGFEPFFRAPFASAAPVGGAHVRTSEG